MRALILSDLHFEFHHDGGNALLDDFPKDVDLVILAGDICLNHQIPATLELFCRVFPKVIYIHGNHEFYHSDRENTVGFTEDAVIANDNLIWLDNEVATIDGTRFLGAPLWFPYDQENEQNKSLMNDFGVIEDFEDWVYEQNREALKFLKAELRKGDVVITHYVPTQRSVHPRWKGSDLNAFFVCDVEDLIKERHPKLWVHGHTHDSFDYLIGDTRIVCNPFGYVRLEENRGFDEAKIIDL